MLRPLSGIVAKGYKGHKHEWKLGQIRKYGAILSVWVCEGHDPRLVKAFEMEVYNRDAFQGSTEYLMRQS